MFHSVHCARRRVVGKCRLRRYMSVARGLKDHFSRSVATFSAGAQRDYFLVRAELRESYWTDAKDAAGLSFPSPSPSLSHQYPAYPRLLDTKKHQDDPARKRPQHEPEAEQ